MRVNDYRCTSNLILDSAARDTRSLMASRKESINADPLEPIIRGGISPPRPGAERQSNVLCSCLDLLPSQKPGNGQPNGDKSCQVNRESPVPQCPPSGKSDPGRYRLK